MSVERILLKNSIDFTPTGSYYKIRCLDPEHEDKNPSMLVSKHTGWANCKSCGASYNLFQFFNEKPNWMEVRKNKFRDKLQQVASDSLYYEFPSTAVFWDQPFKGIRSEVIQKFQAFQCADFPGYLSFPLRNASGKIVNFIGRDMTDLKKSKYFFFYKNPVGLVPTNNDFHKSIILVEGWFDFLNLYQHGLTNVRVLFGVDTFRDMHLESLKIEGIDEVILMLDGDEAGRKGSARIKEILEENFIANKTIKLPDGQDPGNFSQSQVTKLKETLYGVSSNSRD